VLSLDDPGLTAELREVLRAAGFDGEGMRAALGSGGELLTTDAPVHTRRLEGVAPLGTLADLLLLELPVGPDAARRAFAPLALERLDGLGLIEIRANEVCGRVRVVPHDDLLIASDRRARQDRPDHVAGVHGPSITLSHLTVRAPVETSLDVGTGCGIQGLLAARHSGRVVATDVNERALRFAAFNAQLNGVENIELRAGSFFAPVEGERFGQLTCNPPYVISPEAAFLFRDSGLEGDTVSRQVVERAPERLEEGAFAQMLVSWVVAPGTDWSDAPRSWVEGSGCDAWLLHDSTVDPLTHAAAWLRHEVGNDADAYGAALDRWLAYYDRLGIEQIAVGAMIMRRRSGDNWVLATELPSERLRPASDHILRVFAAQDFLVGLADERELLAERLTRTEHSRLEQRVVYDNGRWTVAEMTLALEDGLGFHAGLDATTGRMLTALDGERTLGDVAGELARAEDISREEIEQTLVRVASRMLSAGFLVRA
jgi:methylase of polypeptide subunit release factors